MRCPRLNAVTEHRETVDIFRGYNAARRIGSGEFAAMENLSSDLYPLLSVRSGRSFYARPASPQGIIAKDVLCYVDGSKFVAGDTVVEMNLSVAAEDCPKQLTSMGAYVIILPDKKYINTRNLDDFGNIEAQFHQQEQAQFSLYLHGDISPLYAPAPPQDPEDLTYWVDTSGDMPALKQYSAASSAWTAADPFVKIKSRGIESLFRIGDGVTISGITAAPYLNGNAVIQEAGEDYILIRGLLGGEFTQSEGLSLQRKMPLLDFATESGNRLWGCRYGLDGNGNFVNEIYASALGDFRNWNCFEGLSTDSYAASCGTDGPFTGAVSYLGAPLFFKENCIHKVYGSYPAAYKVQDTACRGVQSGCHGSLALVDETLFYKSRAGVCAYDGALPVCVSDKLGMERYSDAVGGALGGKYYVSMKNSRGGYDLFVFDSVRNLWHREDDFRASGFASCGGQLYGVDAGKGNIMAMTGGQETVAWLAETGEIGLENPDKKYISRLTVRLFLEEDAKAVFSVSYDGGDWEEICTVFGTSLDSFAVPLRLRRCDHLRLRMEGQGRMRLYGITKTIQRGS